VNNIAAMVDSTSLRYVSHAIVQLYPVKAKNENCVATVVEFASLNDDQPIKKFKRLLEELSLSEETGMAVLKSFGAERLLNYGNATRSGEVSIFAANEAANDAGVEFAFGDAELLGRSLLCLFLAI